MKESLSVNLLPSKSRLQLKQLKIVRRVNLGVGIGLGVFLLAALIVFTLDFYSQFQIKKNTEALLSAKGQFIQFADRIDELQNLRFRTKLVAQAMEKRHLFAPELKEFESLLGKEVTYSSLNLEEKQISVKGELPGLSSFKDFEEKVEKGNYSTIVLKNLGVNEKGVVSFSLEISFLEKSKGRLE